MRTSIALIVFVVSAQATPAFADDCAYAVTSSAPVLIIGARDETLFLEPSTGCNHQPTTHIVLRTGPDDPSPVSATVKVASDNKTLDLDIPLVPRDLVARAYKFQLVEIGAKDPFGTVDLPVEAITVESRLKVGYLDGNLDGLQSGLSDTENASPIAVTSEADDGVQVVNTAVIDLPDELPTAETDSAYWVVLDPSWKGDDPSTISSAATGGMEQVLRFAANADNAEAPYPLRRATAIPFQVMTRKRTPLRVVLELRQKTGPTHTETDAPWLSLDLQLAAEARPESLPLPVADYAEIKCDGHVIRGEGAMESADLTSHRCRLDLEAQSGNQK